MTRTILVVEDDADLARGVCFNLELEGYAVECAGSARAARGRLSDRSASPIDLVLLDLGLPDQDGLELLRELRAARVTVPIVCLTARAQESDVVMGLALGADDYVKKPFGVAELAARVDAVLRRAAPAGDARVAFGEAVVDLGARVVTRGGAVEELTPIEIDVLRYLLARRGTAVDRQQLLRDLWGLDPRHSTRTLDNHVARLRKKIEVDPAAPRFVVTVHGVGYRLERG